MKVLIVDDAMFMRGTIKNILLPLGLEIVEAANGKEAIERYAQEKPDLVTMDITMPDMDGVNAVQEIKKIDANAKVLMVSAMGQQSKVMEALNAGAIDFIVKPFQADRFIQAIQKATGTSLGAAV